MSSEDVASGCSGSVRNVRWSGGAWLRLRHRKWSAAELTGVMLFIASILLLVIGLLLTGEAYGKSITLLGQTIHNQTDRHTNIQTHTQAN